ncbi:MAG: hypothetical protein RLY61_481 [Candidatus Parcubacteria bacterium]|jgi:hypothetical protein
MKIAQADPFKYIPDEDPTTGIRTFKNLSEWAIYAINLFAIITFSVSLISIIVAGIKYTISKGDVKATQMAQQTLIYSIGAMVGVLCSYVFFRSLLGTLNFSEGTGSIIDFVGGFSE